MWPVWLLPERVQVVLERPLVQQLEPQPELAKLKGPALKLVPVLALQMRWLELQGLARQPQLQPAAELVAESEQIVAAWALLPLQKKCC